MKGALERMAKGVLDIVNGGIIFGVIVCIVKMEGVQDERILCGLYLNVGGRYTT